MTNTKGKPHNTRRMFGLLTLFFVVSPAIWSGNYGLAAACVGVSIVVFTTMRLLRKRSGGG